MRKLIALTLIASCISLTARADDPPTGAGSPRATTLSGKLQDQGNMLADKLDRLCQRVTQTGFNAVRASWLDVLGTWYELYGTPVQLTDAPIFTGESVTIPEVESAIRAASQASIQEGALPQPNVRGLTVLEYLLWGEDRPLAQLGRIRFKQRCNYTELVATELASQATRLNDLLSSTGPLPRQSALMLVNERILDLRDRLLALSVNNPIDRSKQGWWRSRQTRFVAQSMVRGLTASLVTGLNGNAPLLASRPDMLDAARSDLASISTVLGRMGNDGLMSNEDQAQAWAALTHLADLSKSLSAS
ncbi:hypothetical protein KSF73_13885 [Burkholderiaceae bacterium DAT-1]|nr:hypothetical protein [Burkholderiaceae bacterium DAT-1]